MKILWFSNYRFSDSVDSATGTWIGSMGLGLLHTSSSIRLYNITGSGAGNEVCRCDACGVQQWLLPNWKILKTGLPSEANIAKIQKIVQEINPDIIHVWGLESYYGLLLSRGYVKCARELLEMQGIRYAVADFYMGNLTYREQLSCIGIKELVRKASPIMSQRQFYAFRDEELEMMRYFKHISYQSRWVLNYLKMLARPDAIFHATRIFLRKEFAEDNVKWQPNTNQKTIFALCASTKPYKGTHVLIRAFSYLKQKSPKYADFKLVFGGGIGRLGLLKSGYIRLLEHDIARLGLKDSVQFVGALTATQIREYMLQSAVFVHPSFVETYSLTVAEAMCIGMPCVISYAGAMPELAEDGVSALYFPAGDAVLCAERIHRIIESVDLAKKLSANARKIGRQRNDPVEVVKRQMEIYEAI